MTTIELFMKPAEPHAKPLPRGPQHRSFASLRVALAALCMTWFVPTTTVHAADAEALLNEGKKLAAEKKYDEACPKLAESYKLAATPATLIELALCHKEQGKVATAWGELLDAEADARKAGRSDLESRARGNSKALEGKLPRVVVAVAQNTPGLEIAIDGQKLDLAVLGKGRPVDPGDHKITATAPGRKPFETVVSLKLADKKNVTIPALVEDPNAPAQPAKPEDKPAEGTAQPEGGSANASSGGGDAKPTEGDKPKETKPDSKGPPIHKAKRIVLEVGAMAGGQFVVGGGSQDELSNVNYEYLITDDQGVQASQLASCRESGCRALTDPAIGVPVGGTLFVGYALNEQMHIGGRFYGSYLVTGGYSLFIGPSLSKQLKPKMWVGGTLLVGFGAQNAVITGARGDVPSEWVALNNNADEVVIDLSRERSVPKEGNVNYDFTFGLAGEFSYELAELGHGDGFTTGSLYVSAWPTLLKTWNGFAAALPVGIGYRFH